MQFTLITLVAAFAATTSASYIPRQLNTTAPAGYYSTIPTQPIYSVIPTSSSVAVVLPSSSVALSTGTPTSSRNASSSIVTSRASVSGSSVVLPSGSVSIRTTSSNGTVSSSRPTSSSPAAFTGAAAMPTHMAGSALGLVIAGGVAMMF